VTAVDYVPALLDKARQRAIAEGLEVRFEVADGKDLPFDDGRFDVVLSTFGAMFTPDHARSAGKMLRVLRAGGRLGLANWTPEGFIGRLFKVIGRYVPPPFGLQSPALWGASRTSSSCLASARENPVQRRIFTFAIARPRTGCRCSAISTDPTLRAFAALESVGQTGAGSTKSRGSSRS